MFSSSIDQEQWVKLENNKIVMGPSTYKEDDTYLLYVEVLNLGAVYDSVEETIEVVDGKCIRTITGISSYAANRQSEYPPVEEQLDMLWKSMDNGTFPKAEPFYSTIQEIKTKYPKITN